MSRIKFQDLWIPAYLKSVLYLALMFSVAYIKNSLLFLFTASSVIMVEFFSVVHKNRSIISLNTSSQIASNTSHNQEQLRKGRISRSFSSFKIRDCIVELFLLCAWFLKVEEFGKFDEYIETILAVLLIGSICFASFYYLHGRMFQLYQSEVDEILTK